MDDKTLTALQRSIQKWEAIVAGTGVDDGVDNCALCQAFSDDYRNEPGWAVDGCFGCPVAEKVGAANCMGTPYDAWAAHGRTSAEYKRHPYKVEDEKGKQLAQAELDFLRSLVPQAPL